MTRAVRRALATLLFSVAAAAHAQAPAPAAPLPVIREIAFAGNDTTRPSTMLRELVVHVGDPADAGAIERSRQAIQDLGLFRAAVTAELQPVEGGVRLLFTVKEKFYFIPAPRADANSDGQYAYGVQLRWYNVLGLNHEFKLTLKQVDRKETGHGKAIEFDSSYTAPFVFDTPYGLDLSYAHATDTVPATPPSTLAYDERRENARAVISRALPHDGPASQGWRLGGGLQWQTVRYETPGAPPSPGSATGLVLEGSYNDVRFNIYSEEGEKYSFALSGTTRRFFSDYASSLVTGQYNRSWYFGKTPHQTVAVFAEGGIFEGGPPGGAAAFEIGGSGDLRGYPLHFRQGNTYYYAGIEALRPVYWDWLRGVVWFEAGNTYNDDPTFEVDNPYSDVGIGARLRIPYFVKFELNVGYAVPLRGRVAGRFFATGRR